MGRPRTLKPPRYVPKSKGACGAPTKRSRRPRKVLGCGQDVYKSPIRYRGRIWHGGCLVQAVREGKV